MKVTGKALGAIMALALTLSLLGELARADDAKKNPADIAKAMAELSQPGPEHAKLKPLAGSWTYTCKFWMDPSKPPMEATGTIERKLILGGRFLEEKVSGNNFDGKPGFEGFGLVGYDKAQQKYTSSWACTMCTGTCTGVGTSDSSGTKFVFHTEAFCPLEKKVVKGREELRFEGPDKTIAESFHVVDGKEVKMMEIVAVRKK